MAAADRWCDRIAALAPHALAIAKPLLRQTADATWGTTITMEEFAEPNCFTTRRSSGPEHDGTQVILSGRPALVDPARDSGGTRPRSAR